MIGLVIVDGDALARHKILCQKIRLGKADAAIALFLCPKADIFSARKYGIAIDFEGDVIPLSNYARGGSVTERHLSSALACRMIDVIGKGDRLVKFIKTELQLPISGKIEGFLLDENNPHMMYDLLGWIKSQLISKFYIDATDECPDVKDVLALSDKVGAISAYAYLGDVGDSVTGDKKAQKFEDDYLDELFVEIKKAGFRVTTPVVICNSDTFNTFTTNVGCDVTNADVVIELGK